MELLKSLSLAVLFCNSHYGMLYQTSVKSFFEKYSLGAILTKSPSCSITDERRWWRFAQMRSPGNEERLVTPESLIQQCNISHRWIVGRENFKWIVFVMNKKAAVPGSKLPL